MGPLGHLALQEFLLSVLFSFTVSSVQWTIVHFICLAIPARSKLLEAENKIPQTFGYLGAKHRDDFGYGPLLVLASHIPQDSWK